MTAQPYDLRWQANLGFAAFRDGAQLTRWLASYDAVRRAMRKAPCPTQ